MLLRFADIRTRIETPRSIPGGDREFGYEGSYTTVYPIKSTSS